MWVLLECTSCNIGRGRERYQAVRFGGPKSFGRDPATGRFFIDRMANDRRSLICGSWGRGRDGRPSYTGKAERIRGVAGKNNEQEMRPPDENFFSFWQSSKGSGAARII